MVENKAAGALKDVTVSEDLLAQKDALTNNPTSSQKIVDFYTACMLERQDKAARKRAGASGQPMKTAAIALEFTPSPKKRRTDPSLPASLNQKAKKVIKRLEDFDCVGPAAKQKLKHLVAQMNEVAEEREKQKNVVWSDLLMA